MKTLQKLARRPALWLLDKMERVVVWIHGERKLDPYKTGKLAWEIRNLKLRLRGGVDMSDIMAELKKPTPNKP